MVKNLGNDDEWEENDDPSDHCGVGTTQCPYCRREIYEDAERCPHCEQYISSEDAMPAHKPLWIIAGALLCLLVIYFWVFNR